MQNMNLPNCFSLLYCSCNVTNSFKLQESHKNISSTCKQLCIHWHNQSTNKLIRNQIEKNSNKNITQNIPNHLLFEIFYRGNSIII